MYVCMYVCVKVHVYVRRTYATHKAGTFLRGMLAAGVLKH